MLGVLGRILGGPLLYRGDGVEVRERHGVRTLHLDSDTVQSAMRVEQPDALELSYTRSMMAFLLFAPPPRSALLVGLGGGSLAKFIYRHMPETRLHVVEISRAVVEVAHAWFGLPAQCARLSITIADGAQRVGCLREAVDLLLVDAYDGRSLAASLATDTFFQAAHAALAPGGVFVMNLWSSDRAFDRNVQRIERAFKGQCVCLPAERPGNVAVFAFRAIPARLRWAELRSHATGLQERFGLEFPRFVEGLRKMNDCDTQGLRLEARRGPA
jgi:spermidine synthase